MRLSGAVLATAVLAAPVFGQSLDIRAPASAPRATTGAAPAAAPAAAAAPTPAPEWSGQSGASGHPLMTAQAIRAAAANFRSCLEGLWPLAARRGVSRARVRRQCRRADARPAHHGSARQPARIHQVVLGLSRHAGERRAHRATAARSSRSTARPSTRSRRPTASTATSSPRSGAWSPTTARMVGDRPVIRSTATLACIGRRQDYFRDEFLSALEILAARRRAARPSHRLVGGRLRPDPVHADLVQALRRRFRRRRPPRRRRLGARPHRLDRQQSEEGRLGQRARPGATRSWCRRTSISCSPIARADDDARMGARSASAAPAASRFRARAIAPICWCRPARRGRAS